MPVDTFAKLVTAALIVTSQSCRPRRERHRSIVRDTGASDRQTAADATAEIGHDPALVGDRAPVKRGVVVVPQAKPTAPSATMLVRDADGHGIRHSRCNRRTPSRGIGPHTAAADPDDRPAQVPGLVPGLASISALGYGLQSQFVRFIRFVSFSETFRLNPS